MLRLVTAAALVCLVFTGSSPAAARGAAPPFPTGSFSMASLKTPDCPPGLRCQGFEVKCPEVRGRAAGVLATGEPRGRMRGLALFFSGADGRMWWTERGQVAEDFLEELRGKGYRVVQVRWKTPWVQASEGEDVGPARLACRPATVAKWVHDTSRLPEAAPGRCGFCIVGQSGGASQAVYTLTHYGLDRIVDVMVATSGPVHADIASGCDGSSGLMAFNSKSQAEIFDRSYGFSEGGPCQRRDRTWTPRWKEDSLDSTGDHSYPDTTVRFVFAGRDDSPAPLHALRYVLRLQEEGTPFKVRLVPCVGHGLTGTAEGIAALREALGVQGGGPVPSATSTPRCQGTSKFAAPIERLFGLEGGFSGGAEVQQSQTPSPLPTASTRPVRSAGTWRPWMLPPLGGGLLIGVLAFVMRARRRVPTAPPE